ncbi:RTA1-domain-containing protein [Tilletiaria anomala UBC 951]|uniref:RTA1-domain-containing protein n=1 Tax=Tilletiaria anomala (strain ATCC 24038 / CBS 436.72 / UBC 951) TaxID=1037660 RepID=A0A066VJJ9_TILAU|nr:RTA1-domain-containing protein [Tilletiaria anomala UBC 951]KDN41671.1 RTA1-domain-containing protein [Tilletiaria anomala UBC 951]
MSVFQDVESCQGVDPRPDQQCSLDHVPYKYVPALWLGVAFTACHALLFLTHITLSGWRWKRGGFMLLAAVCSAGEIAGWASRIQSSLHPFDVDAYIAQLVCLILSPVFISAVNYVTLERIMDVVGHDFARLKKRTYFTLFVSGDILSLIIQAVGGGLSATANTEHALQIGSQITLAGVVIQVAVTAPFELLFADFHLRHYIQYKKERQIAEAQPLDLSASTIPSSKLAPHSDKLRKQKEQEPQEFLSYGRWSKSVLLLSLASTFSTVMILMRCIYRLVEMAQGWSGFLASNETFFTILDGLAIFFSVAIFIPFHPSLLLPDVNKDYKR